jgi:hypothetical protein
MRSILGIEASDKAIELFTERFNKLGVKSNLAKATCLDIETSQDGIEGQRFDVIHVCAYFSIYLLR